MNIEDEILITTGISSKVFEGDEFRGHILLLDYDNKKKESVLWNISNLPGISILRPSSDTGWHVWNLTVRTRDECGLLGLKMWSDPLHHAISYTRKNWILRLGPKMDVNNEEYKPAPGDIEIYSNRTDLLQSRPHLDILKSRFQYRFKRIEDQYNWIGDKTVIESYPTCSDELREAIANEEIGA